MAHGPADFLVRWDLDAISTPDEAAFETTDPEVASSRYTITFWFQATNLVGIRVLANAGGKSASQKGWSIFLRDRSVFFLVNLNGRHSQVNSIPPINDSPWHHFAIVVDQTNQAIMGYFDGSSVGWQTGKSSESIEPDSLHPQRRRAVRW